jgi:hypothetical protein
MNYLDNTKQALAMASDKLAKADLFGAVTVMQAAPRASGRPFAERGS